MYNLSNSAKRSSVAQSFFLAFVHKCLLENKMFESQLEECGRSRQVEVINGTNIQT